ncbi:MAG: hypothetical protein ABGX16_13505 [Pirellulales bacterium]
MTFGAALARDYEVQIRDPATNAVLETVFSFTTGDPAITPVGDTGWQSHTADLSTFGGQTVRLTFREQIPESFTGPAQIEFDAITLFYEPADDYYRIEANAGDPLTIEVTILSQGQGKFFNNLEASAELLDPSGVVVASASQTGQTNFTLDHTALQTGTYSVRLFTDNDTSGEYVLAVNGHTGLPPLFEVIATAPDHGDLFAELSQPAQMVLNLSSSVLVASVESADLTIDGTPVTGVTIVDSDTLSFDLPLLTEGIHNATIAAGALTNLQNTPLEAFASSFTFDFTAPRIIDSSIQDGDIVTAGPLTYTVQFDEELDSTNLDVTDMRLVGFLSGTHTPTQFSYDSGTSRLTLQYENLPEDRFTLILISDSWPMPISLLTNFQALLQKASTKAENPKPPIWPWPSKKTGFGASPTFWL